MQFLHIVRSDNVQFLHISEGKKYAKIRYSKNHLVPFSEHLPFGIKSNFLEKNFDFHFWNEGKEVIVFEDEIDDWYEIEDSGQK
mgnify:CR=1 FL=1